MHNLEELYLVIKEQIEKFKETGEMDLSFCYEDLKKFSGDIMCLLPKQWDYKKECVLFGFAIEIAKKAGTSFWREFYGELNIDFNTRYWPLFNTLCAFIENLGIRIKISLSGKRLLVGTLQIIAKFDPGLIEDARIFFIEYYTKHKGEDLEDFFKQSQIYEKYAEQEEKFIATVRYLDDAVDYVIKNCLDRLDDDPGIREELKQKFGIDPGRYARRRFATIVRAVLNIYTPRQFEGEVLQKYRGEWIELPDGLYKQCSALMGTNFYYGVYKIDGEEYRVTPDIRIDVEDMKKWDYEQFRPPFKGYTYYKKKECFSAPTAVRKFVDKDEKFYVWCNKLSVGEKCEVDGKIVRGREDFSWNPELFLVWGDGEKLPSLQVKIGEVRCFYREYKGKVLELRMGDQTVKKFELDREGYFRGNNIELCLDPTVQRVVLSACVDGKSLKTKEIVLEDHMLFSAHTHKQIKPRETRKEAKNRDFGEYKYYLFSIADQGGLEYKKEIDGKEHIKVSNRGEKFGRYNIYEVLWVSSENFLFRVDGCEWQFGKKGFLDWHFSGGYDIFESISETKITVWTNIKRNVERKIELLVFSNDGTRVGLEIENEAYAPVRKTEKEETPDVGLSEEISAEENEIESMPEELNNVGPLYFFQIEGEKIMDAISYNDLFPGEYELEISIGGLSCSNEFYIIPKVNIRWPAILKENEKAFVQVLAEDTLLRERKSGVGVEKLEIEIHSRVQELLRPNTFPPEIKPQSINIPVGFTKPAKSKEYSTDDVYVFGYRLYLKSENADNRTLLPANELGYYNLDKGELIVFTRPGETVEVIAHEKCILNARSDDSGCCWFRNLSSLKECCTTFETPVEIKSTISLPIEFSKFEQFSIPFCEVLEKYPDEVKKAVEKEFNLKGLDYKIGTIEPPSLGENDALVILNISKNFKIVWNPQVYAIKCRDVWFGGDIAVKAEIEGPPCAEVIFELTTPIGNILKKIVKKCSGKREIVEVEFQELKDTGKTDLFLMSFFTSRNNELLRSRSFLLIHNAAEDVVKLIWYNKGKEELKEGSLSLFLDRVVDFAYAFLLQPKPVYLGIPSQIVREDFVALLAAVDSGVKIILPHSRYEDDYAEITEITEHRDTVCCLENEFDLKSRYKDCLTSNPVNNELKSAFDEKGVSLSDTATIVRIDERYWKIEDGKKEIWIEDAGAQLRVHYERKPDDILNPIKVEDITGRGIGVSSKEIADRMGEFLPKPNPILVCEAQEFSAEEVAEILDLGSGRNMVFVGDESKWQQLMVEKAETKK